MSASDIKQPSSVSYITNNNKQKTETYLMDVNTPKSICILVENNQKNVLRDNFESLSFDSYITKKDKFDYKENHKRTLSVSYVSDDDNSRSSSTIEDRKKFEENNFNLAQSTTEEATQKSDYEHDTETKLFDNNDNFYIPESEALKEQILNFSSDVVLLTQSDHLREMRTILRDK